MRIIIHPSLYFCFITLFRTTYTFLYLSPTSSSPPPFYLCCHHSLYLHFFLTSILIELCVVRPAALLKAPFHGFDQWVYVWMMWVMYVQQSLMSTSLRGALIYQPLSPAKKKNGMKRAWLAKSDWMKERGKWWEIGILVTRRQPIDCMLFGVFMFPLISLYFSLPL